MSGIILTEEEAEELYVILKPGEGALGEVLSQLLKKVENALFDRLTIEEIETLGKRFPNER